jgi:hypothetical protein
VKLICKKDFPTFVWTDMKEYEGKKEGEHFEVPDKVGELLVTQKLAEQPGRIDTEGKDDATD